MKKLLFFTLILLLAAFAWADTFTIGTGTSSTSYSPFYGLYDFGWNKIIYTAAEINTAGLSGPSDIYGLGFYAYNTPVNYVMLDQKVYVRHTAMASYGTATDETGTGYPAAAGFTQVFDANVVYNGIGWYYIMFSSPFAWDGTNNLEIFYENWDGDYYSGYPTHTYTSTSTNYRTVYKYADTTYPTTAGTRTYNRPNLRIVTQTLDGAPTVNLVSPATGGYSFTDAVLTWNNAQGMASSYDVYLGTSSNPPYLTNTPDMTYAPTLLGGTTYYWKIVARNANGPGTASAIWSFTTPGDNQLAESFENTTFPPTGWSNPGGFARSTTTPYHLTAGAYKSTATAAMLNTPMLELTETSELNFMARAAATTGIGRIQIKYSDDGTTWNAIGDEIAMPANSNWNNYVVDLSSLDGDNYYIGFECYSSTTTAAGIYIDFVIGPELAALTPDPATLVYPADAGWAFTDGTLQWSAATTGGIPSSYDVYFGTTDPPDFAVNQTGTTYTPTLAAGSTYYWQIVPRNGTGPAENCPVWSFSTPTVTQLAESFDATAFPPLGWANPGTWSRSTTTPFYGAATAYKSASTTPALLVTPLLEIGTGDALDFYYRTSSTTGYGLMNIKYSTDAATWSQIGATISMPTTTTWNSASVALGAIPAGNYYLAFEVFTSTSTSSIYIDHVFGPDFAAVAPGPAAPTAPADLAVDVVRYPSFTWTAPTTGGIPEGYKIYCDTSTDPTTLLGTVTGPTTLTWTSTTALNWSTLYYWKVVAYNASGDATGNTVRSFTVMADPTIYTMPWWESFGTTGTTFPPANWFRGTGLLADPSTVTSSTTYWIQDNWLNDTTVSPVNWAARMNIYSTSRTGWLITPPIQMPGAGYQLELDIALTDYGAYGPPDTPTDDRFIILIGDGSTWAPANIVREWNNTGSPYVYDSIPYTGEHVVIPIDSYTGIKQIAFYGESILSGGDNDFFVDNVRIRLAGQAPDHVTLLSPADDVTTIDPGNCVLNWQNAVGGGDPDYYEVYVGENPIDPANEYYGEYFYETTVTSLNLSDQGDIDLGYETTWYWAVMPFNDYNSPDDPDPADVMVWNFTTLPDPAIVALPHEEYFDSVTAPALPYGWTGYVNSVASAAYVRTINSTTYAQSAPNSAYLTNSTDAAADLRLITPMIDASIPLNTIKLKFYARSSSAGYPLLVGSVSATDGTGVFTQLQSISLTTTKTEYEVSFEDYVGTDQYVCFKHGLGGTSRSLYVDNVRLLELLPVDLAATAISNPGIMQAGTAYDFTVTVFNEGTVAQSSYTVQLMEGVNVLATLPVTTTLDPAATAQHVLSWTPSTGGVYQVFGKVVATGDGNTANDETPLREVYVLDNTMTVVPVGDDATTSSGYYLPLGFYHKNSVTEELYFTDEMHLESGSITAVVYKNTFASNLQDKPVKIWMAHTTVSDLTGGWLPAVDYTLVFDGLVDFPSGINYIVIPLDTPFAFTGGTLATRVNRPMDTVYFTTSDKFYYTTTAAHTSRSRYLVSDATTYDPLAPSAAGTAVGYVPNTMFIVENAVMQTQAILNGYVYEAGTTNPIEGATVTLTDERYSTTTDETGYYEFGFWENHTVDAYASATDYYNSATVTGIALTLSNTVSQNLTLQPLPSLTVSGVVTSNDYPAGLEGATVELFGYHNYSTTTGVGGVFSIADVKGNSAGSAYTWEVSKEGYETETGSTTLYEANLDLGTINLTEFLWPAYDLVASHEAGDARLLWEPAAAPDYYFTDFETDNGGWVGSGYGDWEYTNAYTLTGYSDPDTYVDTPPTSAYSGDGLWGTKVLGSYSGSGAWSYLRQTFDLTGYDSPVLKLWHYMDGYNTYDYGLIKVNGTTVWGSSSAAVFMPWQQITVDLSAYEGLTSVEISFEWIATTVVNYAGWYIDDLYVGPATRVMTPQLGTRSDDRWLLNYDVYRFLAADEGTPGNWSLVNDAVADTTYLDTGFAALPEGSYKWAVKANYSGGLESEAIVSNALGVFITPPDIEGGTIGATGTNVSIGWPAEPGATYYIIYGSNDPYAAWPWAVIGYSATPSYVFPAGTTPYKFFKIAAADGEMPASKNK